MKILTGSLRGRTLIFKPNSHLRPTADKVRKSIFDRLQGQVEGKRVLDLFSGTGALGFEALSNGASYVTFVEKNRPQCHQIRENLVRLGFETKALVLNLDVSEAIHRLGKQKSVFDLVFLDPPYEKGLGGRTLGELSQASLIEKDGLIFLESRKDEFLKADFGPLKQIQEKIYGDTKILIYGVGV